MVLRVRVPSDLVGGDVEEGYGPVADANRDRPPMFDNVNMTDPMGAD